MNVKDLEVFSDFILIISQSTGEWGVRSLELAKYKGYLIKLSEAFHSVSFNNLSRSKNKFTDALATLYPLIKISEKTDWHPLVVETHDRPEYYYNVEVEPDGNPWYHHIKTFLKDGLLGLAREARTLLARPLDFNSFFR